MVASNDDVLLPDTTSTVTFAAVSGTEYRIAVDGYNGVSGNYTLTWLYPVVNETVISTAVTNISNFIYDSDALIGGVYNRDKLLITSSCPFDEHLLGAALHNLCAELSVAGHQ